VKITANLLRNQDQKLKSQSIRQRIEAEIGRMRRKTHHEMILLKQTLKECVKASHHKGTILTKAGLSCNGLINL
jgi:hypothetical protein